jgi:hypothetical protein
MKTLLFFFALSFSFCAFAQDQKTQNSSDAKTIRQKMKEDGLSEKMIDKLIEQRKELEASGRKVSWTSMKQNPSINAPCGYMGVENGWGAWQWRNGTNSGANPPTYAQPPASNPASSPTGPAGPSLYNYKRSKY